MAKKDKANKEFAARERHREQLKSKKRIRSEEPTLIRESLNLRVKPVILIVSEGENTEPSYFDKFKLSSVTIKTVGTGYNTVSLVELIKNNYDKGQYDQIWCVFDKDDFDDFNDAIFLAEKYNYSVAYSNQAFEYWLLLHLEDHQGGKMNRVDYNRRINKLLKQHNIKYDGGKNGCKRVTEELFDLLDGFDDIYKKIRVDLAIERAERIYNRFDHLSPAKEESSTSVFMLVKELKKYV